MRFITAAFSGITIERNASRSTKLSCDDDAIAASSRISRRGRRSGVVPPTSACPAAGIVCRAAVDASVAVRRRRHVAALPESLTSGWCHGGDAPLSLQVVAGPEGAGRSPASRRLSFVPLDLLRLRVELGSNLRLGLRRAARPGLEARGGSASPGRRPSAGAWSFCVLLVDSVRAAGSAVACRLLPIVYCDQQWAVRARALRPSHASSYARRALVSLVWASLSCWPKYKSSAGEGPGGTKDHDGHERRSVRAARATNGRPALLARGAGGLSPCGANAGRSASMRGSEKGRAAPGRSEKSAGIATTRGRAPR